MFKKAFTLAEVLIVVALIGTVAALTVPNLSDSYKEDNTIVKLQKFQNELQSAQKQAILKYGNYNDWFNFDANATFKALETNQRYLEFLEISNTGVTFPDTTINSTSNCIKTELKDGSIIAITNNGSGAGSVYIATEGINSTTKGKNIFGFTINAINEQVYPMGRGSDRASDNKLNISDNIMGTNWALTNGNLDYLKCAASLNWETKTSCN